MEFWHPLRLIFRNHEEIATMKYRDLTSKIIECALEVHTFLGPGLLEKVYEECLEYELKQAGLYTQRQLDRPVEYKGFQLEQGYRIDLLVDRTVVVEIKAVDTLTDVHSAQILSYMKLGGHSVGLLFNFNVKSLRDGIRRFAI